MHCTEMMDRLAAGAAERAARGDEGSRRGLRGARAAWARRAVRARRGPSRAGVCGPREPAVRPRDGPHLRRLHELDLPPPPRSLMEGGRNSVLDEQNSVVEHLVVV